MKRFVTCLISILFFFQTSLLSYSSDPKDFVKELVNDAINKDCDKNHQLPFQGNFTALLKEKMAFSSFINIYNLA